MKDTEPEGLPAADGELVALVLRGDRAAFDILVGRHQRQVTALAYRLLGNAEDALDVSQEAFLRAYRKLGSLSEPRRFGSWLMRIVAHQALNYRRGRALRKTLPLGEPEGPDQGGERNEGNHPDLSAPRPVELASANELQDRIALAMQQLPEKQRQALVLFSIQQMPQKEVAQLLGLSVEAVKWHVFTARKKLKERLKDIL